MADFKIDDTVDITTVVCPTTFVKAKVALEELDDGQILSIKMNDGEPVQNVPRSIKYTVGLRYFHAILFLDFISLMTLIESHANFFLDCLDLYHEFSFGVHLQTQCLDISIAKVLHFFHGSGHFCGFIYLVSKLQRVLSNE